MKDVVLKDGTILSIHGYQPIRDMQNPLNPPQGGSGFLRPTQAASTQQGASNTLQPQPATQGAVKP